MIFGRTLGTLFLLHVFSILRDDLLVSLYLDSCSFLYILRVVVRLVS